MAESFARASGLSGDQVYRAQSALLRNPICV